MAKQAKSRRTRSKSTQARTTRTRSTPESAARRDQTATAAQERSAAPAFPDAISLQLEFEPIYSPDATRAAGRTRSVDLEKYQPDDVIEVTLENGSRFYTKFADYLNDYGSEPTRGAAKPSQIELPLVVGPPGGARALGSFNPVKLVQKVVFRLAGPDADPLKISAEWSALALSAWYERKQLQRSTDNGTPQRLWKCVTNASQPYALVDFDKKELTTEKPILLFIHGTASSTKGSFSDLWSEGRLEGLRGELFRAYPDRIYAFEHCSLTQSPVANVVDLLKNWLPTGARVHLVSHSRGGLVGELLARGERDGDPFRADELDDAFANAGADYKQLRAELEELNDLLKLKQIQVERFVRVACPARGTTLASGRLDKWLSVVLEVLDLMLPAGARDFFALFKSFALALIKTRDDPTKLPGLEAMIPGTPLVTLLNLPDVEAKADLHVIAGDIEGGPLWERMAVWVTDRFYQGDHDLVVNTAAMYGGTKRAAGNARFYFAEGPDVNHFSYFKNSATARKMIDALTRGPAEDGFEALDPATRAAKERSERRMKRAAARAARAPQAPGGRPAVVLIPGIMGSELAQNEDCIWVNALRLAAGGLGRLAIDQSGVSAIGLIDSAYGDLADYLADTYDVHKFPYDWRLSLRDEAKRLRDLITALLDERSNSKQPVCIVAHSMGGLLSRVFIADYPKVWARMCEQPGARLVMLGTPNGGSHTICRLLTDREPLVQGLALADIKHSRKEIVDIVKRYPGVLQMLPNYQSEFDFFDQATWTALAGRDNGRWDPALAADLQIARDTRELLDKQILPVERIFYIAGSAPETPARLIDHPPPPPPHADDNWPATLADGALYFEASPRGDGRVLWESGIPKGVNAWYAEAAHGDLADDDESFPAILDLLQRGTTQRLPSEPPGRAARAAARPTIMRTAQVPYVPDDELLRSYALGKAGKKPRARAALPRINVHVAHGNLIYARYAVAVGHYQGDTIISAEALLDQQLQGRLRQRRDLDMYPGPIGTCEVFLSDRFPGAIVAGLGRVGELTPGGLSKTFSAAMLEYALARIEAAKVAGKNGDELTICVSTLLIGTTAGGLSLRDSMFNLISGVDAANRALAQAGNRVHFETVEFLELWEDRAIEAARLLDELRRDAELGKLFTPSGSIQQLRGRRRRAYFMEERDWWQRVQIAAGEGGELTFTRLTDRARAEVSLLPTQRGLVHGFLTDATKEVHTAPEVARTLFELLLPNELKDLAPESRNTVLLVDDEAAQYPWELVEDGLARSREGDYIARAGNDDGVKPMAIRAGLIRQRLTYIYRPEPRMSLANVALVVGNPKLAWPELFADLPGATAEAKAVAKALLARGIEVHENIERDSDSVMSELFARPYRIVHLAGHGVHQFVRGGPIETTGWMEISRGGEPEIHVEQGARDPRDADFEHPRFRVEHAPSDNGERAFGFSQTSAVSGMVLGRGVFLTPREIRQMRAVPDLVFINCCFCAKEQIAPRDRSQLAASIATQLIEMGVRAVIAAGWAVDDAAAEQFAATFYEHMLGGDSFGRAVHEARKRIYQEHGEVNTWGAYQCYGDPDFRLFEGRGSDDGAASDPKFTVLAEAIAEAENVAQYALTARPDNVNWLRSCLDQVAKVGLASWPKSGLLRCALARGYAELDELGKAIAHYQAPLVEGKGDVAMSDIEQLANLKLRYAYELARKQADKPQSRNGRARSGKADADAAQMPPGQLADVLLANAQALLDHLLLYPSGERLALQGGLYKRRAAIAARRGQNAKPELAKMAEFYGRASEAMQSDGKIDEPYPINNYIIAELLRAPKVTPKQAAAWRDKVDAAERAARRRQDELRDFWGRSAVADCLLVRALIDGTLADAAELIVREYREAQNRGASLKEWRSIVENLEFLLDVAPQSSLPKGSVDALARIYASLKSFWLTGESPPPVQPPAERRRRRR